MSSTLSILVGSVGLLVASQLSVMAQGAPTKEDLTLHPGDTITWTPAPGSPHRVRFGGTVAGKTLTPFADVEKILENISPKLIKDGDGFESDKGGVIVTAKVKADAADGSEFNFTCGFNPHTPIMVTVPFQIAPLPANEAPRNIQIRTDPPTKWLLATSHGDVLLGGK